MARSAFERKRVIAVSCFFLGVAATLSVQNIINKFNFGWRLLGSHHERETKEARDPFDAMFQQMQSQSLGMIQQMPGLDADMSLREDDQFVYFDFETGGLEPKNLRVSVDHGQVTVSGQLEKIAEGESESSNISSSFTRAFPAPDNVDAAKADIATAPGKIVVKFPKIRH